VILEVRIMPRIRVVLADDHPIIRSFLRGVLHRTPDIVVVGEASDGPSTIKMTRDLDPDVVLLDLEMPGFNGVEAIYQLQEKGLTTPILMVSSHNDTHLIIALFQIGVTGYIIKDEALTQIVPAVRAAAQGLSNLVSGSLAPSLSEFVQEELTEIQSVEDDLSSGLDARGDVRQVEHAAVRVF
jgi:two-component system, NarL family, response regulator DegU